jgi:hypothetical protein
VPRRLVQPRVIQGSISWLTNGWCMGRVFLGFSAPSSDPFPLCIRPRGGGGVVVDYLRWFCGSEQNIAAHRSRGWAHFQGRVKKHERRLHAFLTTRPKPHRQNRGGGFFLLDLPVAFIVWHIQPANIRLKRPPLYHYCRSYPSLLQSLSHFVGLLNNRANSCLEK